jgi:alkylhydroperoxidase family enzyme
MPRVKVVKKPSDLQDEPNETTRNDLSELFRRLCPGETQPEFKGGSLGWGVLAAQSPRLALLLADLTFYIAREMAWCQRRDLRELAIQTVNYHFKSDFSFRSHLPLAQAAGVSAELLAAIPYWRASKFFDEEQRLVIEYTLAVAAADVSDELFARVAAQFGEKGAIELTVVVAHWSFWAMMGSATRPE